MQAALNKFVKIFLQDDKDEESKECAKKREKVTSVLLNISSISSTVPPIVPLGWYVMQSNAPVPASNTVVTAGQRIAIVIAPGNGNSFLAPPGHPTVTSFMQFLVGTSAYSQVLGILYDTLGQTYYGSAQFISALLQQLLPLKRSLLVDIFGYSTGANLVRFAMEIDQLGKYAMFNNVVLIGASTEGSNLGDPTLIPVANANDPNDLSLQLQVAAAIILNTPTAAAAVQSLQTTGVKLANIELDTRYDNNSGFQGRSYFKDVNQHKVSQKVFQTLRYYTIGGEFVRLETVFPASSLPPYSTLAASYLGPLTPTQTTVANNLQSAFPSLGLLQRYALSIAPAVPQPLLGDGVQVARNLALKTKSCFYREEQYEASFFIPKNHFDLIDTADPINRSFYSEFVAKLPTRSALRKTPNCVACARYSDCAGQADCSCRE
jgi:hypothetical protein